MPEAGPASRPAGASAATEQDSHQIGAKAARGASWLIASRLSARLIDFATLMVLARVLLPHDFGLVAIAMSLVQAIEAVFDLPVAQVLVRADAVDEDMQATAFTVGLLRGFLLAGVLLALAWPASIIFHDPRLLPLIAFLSLAPVLRGLQSPAMAHFARALSFHQDMVIELTAKAGAFACAISVVWATQSYWAIAAGTVASPAIMAAMSYAIAPMRPRLTLSRWSMFGALVGWTSASQALSAINWQADRLLLSRLVPPSALGSFTMASDLSSLPYQALVVPMFRPLTSAFAMIRRENGNLPDRFASTCGVILALILPISLSLSMLAEPAVRLALGPKWQVAVPLLRILALTIPLSIFAIPFSAAMIALDKTHLFWRINIVELVVKLIVLPWFILHYGIDGAVAARGITMGAVMIIYAITIKLVMGIRLSHILSEVWRPLAAGMALTGALAALQPLIVGHSGLWLAMSLGTIGLTGLAAYAIALLLLGFKPARSMATKLRRLRP